MMQNIVFFFESDALLFYYREILALSIKTLIKSEKNHIHRTSDFTFYTAYMAVINFYFLRMNVQTSTRQIKLHRNILI